MPIKFNEGDLFNYRYVPFFERRQMERKRKKNGKREKDKEKEK